MSDEIFGAARKETISSRISAQLREAILRGDMAPGSKINLDRLRENFDVSISPLREAVARLVGDRLVEFEDQRGYRVAPVSARQLGEITRLRAAMEVQALRASVENGDLEWESNVMRALYRLNHTPRDQALPQGMEQWETAHGEFHAALIEGCGMPILLGFCSVLHNLHDRYRRIASAGHPDGRDLDAEHEAMAMAAISQNADAACDALRDHILETGRHMLATLPEALTSAE